jgi:hypothetical protein
MSTTTPPSARNLYLASLSPEDELVTRRLAETSGIPENDPTWLLLSEVRRSCREATRCTAALSQAASDAASRIALVGTRNVNSPESDGRLAMRIATVTGERLSQNDQVASAIAKAIRHVEDDAARAIRSLETGLRDFMRRRGSAPAASLAFAFALGLASCCAAIWQTYHIGFSYGQNLGYRAGFNDAHIYDRNHR